MQTHAEFERNSMANTYTYVYIYSDNDADVHMSMMCLNALYIHAEYIRIHIADGFVFN